MSRFSRRQFLGMLSGLPAISAIDFSNDESPQDPPPNIVVLYADQWRRQALGVYGNDVVNTPNLDQLGREGMVFDRMYATNPVCAPDRACLLTGRYPHEHGVITNNVQLPEEEVTLPEVLRNVGYGTAFLGKWHLDGPPKPGYVPPARRQGFEYFKGYNRGHPYHNPRYFAEDGERVEPDEYEPVYQTDLALDYMEQHRHRPFLLSLFYGPPHTPYVPPDRFDHYTESDIQWRPNVPTEVRNNPDIIRGITGYYGLCETVDHEVGRIMDFLEQNGMAENTILLFLSDHGDCHGSHGLIRKGVPVEESVGVPMIARWPGHIPAGHRSEAPVGIVDVMPSLLSLAGYPVPKPVSGRDLSPVFRGDATSREPVYIGGRMTRQTAHVEDAGEYRVEYGAWRGIVTPRYKLAVDINLEPVLFTDLEEDPYELNNLADSSQHRSKRRQLKDRLMQKVNRIGDFFPDPPPGKYLD